MKERESAGEGFPREFRECLEWSLREWPQIEPQVEAIVDAVGDADRRLKRSAVDTLRELGLSHGEFRVLMQLVGGQRSHGQLTRALLVSTGTMTNRLDRLDSAGLVRRHPDPGDRRGVLVELTEKGRSTLDRYIDVEADRERQLLGGLNGRDRAALVELLAKLLWSLEPGEARPMAESKESAED